MIHYKHLKTVTNRYKPYTPLNGYEPLHYQSDTTGYPLVQLRNSRVTPDDTLSQWLFEFKLKQYELLS